MHTQNRILQSLFILLYTACTLYKGLIIKRQFKHIVLPDGDVANHIKQKRLVVRLVDTIFVEFSSF